MGNDATGSGHQDRARIWARLTPPLILVAALGALGWVWGSVARRAGTNFLPGRSPAQWILYPTVPSAYTHACVTLDTIFRTEFVLSESPTQATVQVAGFHQYTLAINGMALNTPGRPGHNWKQPDRFEVSGQLRSGTNQVAVRVSNSNGPPALWLALEAGGKSLVSGENWEASCAGGTWRPARLAARPPADPAGSPLHWTGHPGDCWREEWPMLLAFAVLSVGAYWLVDRRRALAEASPEIFRRREILVLLGLAVLWTALFVNDMRALPGRFGFDVGGHLDYVRFILERKTLPERNEMWEASQPPLYYLICAGLVKCLSLSPTQESAAEALRWLGLPIGLAQLALVWASLRLLFAGNFQRLLGGLLLAAGLPALLCLCQYVSNEGMAAALMTASVYLTLRLLRQERISWQGCAGLGLCLGLALLTKATALLLLPLVFGALLWRWLEKRPMPFWQWAARAGIVAVLCLPAGAWHYTHLMGAPHILWQDLGYTTRLYYLRFGRSLWCPWFAGTQSFADGVYSTLWADGLLSGRSALQYGPPWNYGLMAAACWLALVPACAVVVGAALALRKLIRQPSAEWFLILGLGFLALLALLHRCLTVATFGSAKAFYILGALAPFCALEAWGLETLARWSGKGRPVLWVLVGVWAATSYSSFWIVSSSRSSLAARTTSLLSSRRFEEAARMLRARLQTGPDDGQLRVRLANVLSQTGAWKDASEEAESAIRAEPDDASGHMILASVLAAQGRMGEAIEESRHAVELAPGDSQASEELANLCLRQGRFDEAVRAARDGLGIDPYRASLRCLLGRALAGNGDETEAISQLELTARMAVKQAEPQALLGLLLAKHGRPAEAEARFSNAIRLEPNNAELRIEFAKALAAQAKFGDAAGAAAAAHDLALANGQQDLAKQAQQLSESWSAQATAGGNPTLPPPADHAPR